MAEGTRTSATYIETLAPVDELPNMERATRTSKLGAQVERVRSEGSLHGKWVPVSVYETAGAASGAAATLRQKHGAVYVEGFEFATRKVEDDKSALFVRFDQSKIESGGRKRWEREKAARAKARAANAEANGQPA